MHWTTKDGRKIDIKDMSDDHLKNSIAMLRRNGFVGADEYEVALGSAFSMGGEMAQYYAEQSVVDMMPSQCLDAMEYELAVRANAELRGASQLAGEASRSNAVLGTGDKSGT